MSDRRQRWTILEVLDWTRGHFESKDLESPRLDAEVLLAHVLSLPRVMLYAQFDQPMQGEELVRMRALVAKRAAGTPVAHLIGTREFWSLELRVGPQVLIPRPETERLVEVAHRRAPAAKRVVDVGTGSGAVALALASELKEAEVWALEVSEAALDVARDNVERLDMASRVHVLKSDLLEGLPAVVPPVELVVANLPYIPSDEIKGLPVEVRDHDPRVALDGGPDGLALIRALIEQGTSVLTPGGVMVLESGSEQTTAIARLYEAAGFSRVEVEADLSGLERITSAQWGGGEG